DGRETLEPAPQTGVCRGGLRSDSLLVAGEDGRAAAAAIYHRGCGAACRAADHGMTATAKEPPHRRGVASCGKADLKREPDGVQQHDNQSPHDIVREPPILHSHVLKTPFPKQPLGSRNPGKAAGIRRKAIVVTTVTDTCIPQSIPSKLAPGEIREFPILRGGTTPPRLHRLRCKYN